MLHHPRPSSSWVPGVSISRNGQGSFANERILNVQAATNMTAHDPNPERIIIALIAMLLGVGVTTLTAGVIYLLVLLSHP
jgi:hypothetical protein